jgi:hypothetical protein
MMSPYNISTDQIADYIEGKYRLWLHKNNMLSNYYIGMVEHRKDKAQPCLYNGECFHCGCKTPDLFYASRGCSKEEDPCYKQEKKSKIWKLTKLLAPIILKVWIGIEFINTWAKYRNTRQ